MKTLKSKMIGAIAGLAMLSGCAGLGAVYRQSNDPATRAMGTLMYNEGSHEQRMKEQREGRSEVNVNVGSYERQTMNQKQDYSYEIFNNDMNKIEIILTGEKNYLSYLVSRYNNGNFSKKGYWIHDKKENSWWKIKEIKKEGGYYRLVQEDIEKTGEPPPTW